MNKKLYIFAAIIMIIALVLIMAIVMMNNFAMRVNNIVFLKGNNNYIYPDEPKISSGLSNHSDSIMNDRLSYLWQPPDRISALKMLSNREDIANWELSIALGRAYYEFGDYTNALDSFEKAIDEMSIAAFNMSDLIFYAKLLLADNNIEKLGELSRSDEVRTFTSNGVKYELKFIYNYYKGNKISAIYYYLAFKLSPDYLTLRDISFLYD